MPISSISCSIVLYENDKIVLNKTIESIMNSSLVKFLFLIDNSRSPMFSNKFDDNRIQYQFLNKNVGFGAGHNIGLRKSMDLGFEYHLVLNPDVAFEAGTIERLVEYLNRNKEIGNIMPKVLYPDGSFQFLCKLLPTPYDWIGRRFNPFKKIVEKRNELFELRFVDFNQILEIPYLSGCFMLLRLDALRKVGLFDERIFMYCEETDLCRRLISEGYKNVYFPESQIYHHFEKGSHKSFKLTRIAIQSAIYYFNKWGWIFDKERMRINKKALQNLIG